LVTALEAVMQSNSSTNYVNIMFAPNKYDGKDDEHKFSSLYGNYESTGQFGLSIIKSGSTFIHTPVSLLDFYNDTQALNYAHRSEPLNLGSDINPILYTSLNIPIQDSNNDFIGAIGILLPLREIQELTEQF